MASEYLDARLQTVADLVVSKMEKMEAAKWQQPWVSLESGNPKNITGRSYSGSNNFFLSLHTDYKDYKSATYLTFVQAKSEGVMVKKGEKSFPVFYHDVSIKDWDGNKVTPADYKIMNREGQVRCEVKSFVKCYDVFNIDQTNMPEVQPEKYAQLVQGGKELAAKNYHHDLLSDMVEKQAWKCPIQHGGDEALYSYSNDHIRLPLKDTFTSQEGYFGTMLHEMMHSTGHPSRLDRPFKSFREDMSSYAREELVAEIGSALAGMKLGVQKEISDHNIAYVKGWVQNAKGDNRFVYKAVVDAAKAASYTCEHLGIKSELSQKVEEAKGLNAEKGVEKKQGTTENVAQKLLDFNKQLAQKQGQNQHLHKSKGIHR